MYYTIEQLHLRCAPGLSMYAQQELTQALSTLIGSNRDIVPMSKNAFGRRLAQLQATVVATRSRFLRLNPECVFIVVHGRVAAAKRGLQRATARDLAKVTELHITPIGEEG